MKRVLLSFVFYLIGANVLFAQCVPDGSFTQPGYYPDCATGLPHDTVGKNYNTVLQLRVLTDTNVVVPGIGLQHATIDSIVLTNVTGMPSGFTYTTTPSSKSFPGGSNGCVSITDPSATATAGTYPLLIFIRVYGKIFGGTVSAFVDDTIKCYSIQIDPIAGIAEVSNNKFSLSQNFPDPATHLTDIYYTVPSTGTLELRIYNLLGKMVYRKSVFAERGSGKITLDAKDFAQGIYMYSLSNGKTTLSKRMVIANN